MINMEEVLSDYSIGVAKIMENLKHQFSKIRTGRASASILDNIKVEYYGTLTPINQVGQISTPEARILQIQPFDKTMIAAIEKSIIGANIGVNPSNDGNLIRLPFPSLTEERRKGQIRDIKKYAEEARISVRSLRRDKNDLFKKAEKLKELSEDQMKKDLENIQKKTDLYIKDIDKLMESKEQEMIEI